LRATKRPAPAAAWRCSIGACWRPFPELPGQIRAYFAAHADTLHLVRSPLALSGGEAIKQSAKPVRRMVDALRAGNICRHSVCLAIGGGAFLDAAGLAAALFHRGVRLVRIPTTALAQCDSGVGVKNAINYAGSKNLLGTFAPPWAVLNDSRISSIPSPLPLLLDGIAEAVKVAAIKDAAFFRSIERAAPNIAGATSPPSAASSSAAPCCTSTTSPPPAIPTNSAPPAPSTTAIGRRTNSRRSPSTASPTAMLSPSASPSTPSMPPASASCPKNTPLRLVATLRTCGLPVYAPELSMADRRGRLAVLAGLEEFRAHLGGDLTLTVPAPLGSRSELHSVDETLMADCIAALAEWT
jgi:3-dehydroquinate synthase